MTRRDEDDYATAFGKALAEQLSSRQLRQNDLANATGVTPGYVNRLVRGKIKASPAWADLVADVTKASEQERLKLHRAAASDRGYQLDLRPKKPVERP
jgi:plasmid maintenance system antidote protein VapI